MAGRVDAGTAGPGHDRYVIQGREIALPVHVAHARAAVALYTADATAVAADLPPGLTPVLTRPGRTVVALLAVQYVDNPLGDYAEGVVASVVHPSTRSGVVASLRDVASERYGIFVHHMPVSQSFTREAGERIWGFPKTVDILDLRQSPRRAGLRWAADDGEVLELTVPRGGRLPVPPQASTAYTFHGGVVWRTPLRMTGRRMRVGPGGARLRLGTHPIADQLRGFRLGRRALATSWVDHATMDLGAASPLR